MAGRKLSVLPEEELQANDRLVHSFYVCAARGISALLHSLLPPPHSFPLCLLQLTDDGNNLPP